MARPIRAVARGNPRPYDGPLSSAPKLGEQIGKVKATGDSQGTTGFQTCGTALSDFLELSRKREPFVLYVLFFFTTKLFLAASACQLLALGAQLFSGSIV